MDKTKQSTLSQTRYLLLEQDLKSLTKPVGSFLFLGPTGCGKTETARTTSKNTRC